MDVGTCIRIYMQADGGIIFLEIDGVLNRGAHRTHIRLDDDLVDRFKTLVLSTGSCVVLTSFWRHHVDYIRLILNRAGLPAESIIGRVPGASGSSYLMEALFDEPQYESHEEEIKEWLRKKAYVTRYAVLDTRAIVQKDLSEHHVQSSPATGLTEADTQRVRELLARPDGSYYLWSPGGLRAQSNPKAVNKPGTKVGDGVCSCQMVGTTLIVECSVCRKLKANGDKGADPKSLSRNSSKVKM